MAHTRDEVQQAVAAYLALRERIDAGDATWTDLAELFTDDVVYVDPAWGRLVGRAALLVFLDESMRGLDEWRFPVEFTAIDGDNVVIKWTQILPGARDDGSACTQSGVSTLVYAGDGRFSYEEDLLNMVHVFEDMKATTWQLPDDIVVPPAKPDRNFARPS
jgi:limonene-1,2-epoxide hydrolase